VTKKDSNIVVVVNNNEKKPVSHDDDGFDMDAAPVTKNDSNIVVMVNNNEMKSVSHDNDGLDSDILLALCSKNVHLDNSIQLNSMVNVSHDDTSPPVGLFSNAQLSALTNNSHHESKQIAIPASIISRHLERGLRRQQEKAALEKKKQDLMDRLKSNSLFLGVDSSTNIQIASQQSTSESFIGVSPISSSITSSVHSSAASKVNSNVQFSAVSAQKSVSKGKSNANVKSPITSRPAWQ
jgi:hypothetical protein